MTDRPIMTAAELDAHRIDAHGRDYSRSDDGYSDMEVAAQEGWSAISGWGQDGYDLGDWPYVVISVREVDAPPPGARTPIRYYEMRQTVEGDTTAYRFSLEADRNAAIDYLFIWYGIGREYDAWGVLGVTSREGLDAGTLRVPAELRGPFSHARCDSARVS